MSRTVLHLYRYLAALAAVSAACAGYALAVAPWLEPPPVVRAAPVAPRAPVQISTQTRDDLARLFPPEAWERNDAKVKVIETDQATLLLEDYEPTPDGLLKLVPCTIIFYVEMPAADGQSAQRRPIVLQAPHGAELEFDQPLDLARAQLGRLMRGRLRGEVLIFSPPTAADGSDALRLTTREVKLDREKITTTSEVAFQYGPSHGRGRELTITLLHNDDSTSSAKSPSGVQSLTLTRLDQLHLEGSQGLVGAPPLVSGQAAATTALEVTCRGEFAVDLVGQLVRFDNQVEVTQLHAGGPPDRLTNCDELVLAMDLKSQRPPKDKAAGSLLAAASAPAAQSGTSGAPGGRIRRIIARGNPAILDAPGAGAHAEAAVIDYLVEDQLICLEPAALTGGDARRGQIVLRQDEQQLVARRVKYQMTAPQRLGLLLAEGPGELRGVQGTPAARQTLVARWEKSLQIRPDGRNRVISLDGAASVSVDPLGRFDANELHLWVVEVPVANSAVAAVGAAAGAPAGGGAPAAAQAPGDAPPGSKAAARTTILPDRLLAVGKVTLRSPQLDAETARLEAWFVHLPPEPGGPAPATPTLPPTGPLREPVAPASFADGNPTPDGPRDVIRPPNLQKFQVGGELIQLQVRLQGRKTDLEHLTIRGRAVIDELRTPEPGQIPIRVVGDRIELRGGTTPQEAIKIVGQPAEAGGRGLTLHGAAIDVLRQENRLSIPGPGEATLPAPRGSALAGPGLGPAPGLPAAGLPPAGRSPGAAPQQPVHVAWLEGLEFDGQTARIRGDVSARTGTQVVTTQALDAVLAQRIEFSEQGGLAQPELARLHLDGGVKLENRSQDERGVALAYDQVVVPNLTLDLLAGTLHASGPGYVRTVRRQAPGSLPGGGLPGVGLRGAAPQALGAGVPPDAASRPDPAGAGAAPGSGLGTSPPGPGNEAPLTSIHIDFRREIAGLLAKRQIEFRDDVRTTYSPAREFTDQIAAAPGQPARELGERVVVMRSQRLTVTEMALAGQPAWVELLASGNVSAEGASFWIKAATIGYSSDKEVLVVAGDGYADAEVHYQAAPGARASYAKARKFMYWLRDGIFRGEDFSVGDGWLGGFLRLPNMSR